MGDELQRIKNSIEHCYIQQIDNEHTIIIVYYENIEQLAAFLCTDAASGWRFIDQDAYNGPTRMRFGDAYVVLRKQVRPNQCIVHFHDVDDIKSGTDFPGCNEMIVDLIII